MAILGTFSSPTRHLPNQVEHRLIRAQAPIPFYSPVCPGLGLLSARPAFTYQLVPLARNNTLEQALQERDMRSDFTSVRGLRLRLHTATQPIHLRTTFAATDDALKKHFPSRNLNFYYCQPWSRRHPSPLRWER